MSQTMRRVLVSRSALVAVIAMVALGGAWAEAQETPAETPVAAPPAAEPAPQQAPAAPAEPEQAEVPRVFRPAGEIIVDGKAEMNGVLELVYQPNGGEAKLVRVNVVTKAKAKDVAEDLAKELAFTAGADYKVKVSGDTVKMKAKDKKVQPFHLGIEKQALTGLAVRLSKG